METEGMAQMQETDFVPSFKPISKWAYRITKPEKLPWAMRRAFSLALTGKPGPIFLEIPMDVGNANYDPPPYIPIGLPLRSRPDKDDVRRALELISRSESPVIIAGGGVMLSGAFAELRMFAETLAIPVLTTASGRGSIPEDHPLAAGLVGIYRTKISKKLYEEADLIISIGSKNEEFETGGWKFFPSRAKMIQVDIDQFEIGRNLLPEVALIGDARLVLQDLTEGISHLLTNRRVSSERVAHLTKAKAEYEAMVAEECKTDAVPIKSKRVVRELNEVFGRNTILANENGSQDLWSYYFPYYKVLDLGGCMGMPEQTCFGLGVVGAIAAKLTRPDMKVVCTTGDAAFQFAMKEVPTAVQYDAPVTWVVFNNFGLGWERYYQKYWLSGRFTSTEFTAQPDFTKIAEANKCYGEMIERPADIRGGAAEGAEREREGEEAGDPRIQGQHLRSSGGLSRVP
jgi:acetolactate synthase-1/2/3 large subunit